MTLGHRFIKEEFGVTPRIGWQIDTFGHSSVQAYLLGAEVGFDSVFFARIDYQDRAKRKAEKTLEVVWRASNSFGSSAQIFAGAFPENYGPPNNFHYEVNDDWLDDSAIVQDDYNLFDYNVLERVNEFVSAALSQANITRTNHVMWTMGSDFKYQYAHTWFRQLDKFIHYVNQDGRVNALYSTPSIYTDAKHASNDQWPLKTGDFLPYADKINVYWTGYFTSRAALKGYVRMLSGYYLAARQLEFLTGRKKMGPNTDALADALAIAQHHDAVTGTERQHVADDYTKRLSAGYIEAEDVVAASLGCMVESPRTASCNSSENKIQQCPLLNISYCPPSEVDLSNGKKLVVVVYNSLGWKREDVIRVPVVSEHVSVQDSSGREVQSQLLPIMNVTLGIRNYYTLAYLGKSPIVTPKYWLAFTVYVPPLGFNSYIISSAKGKVAAATSETQIMHASERGMNDTVEIGEGNLKLVYSGNDARQAEYTNRRSSVKAPLEQSYSFYSGDDGSVDLQASGAYVFRPNGTYPIKYDRKVPLTILRGPLVDEVHQRINPWMDQITRVYKKKEHVEVEFTVGPIPIDDNIGKEVVTRIRTTINNNKTFYTDSNGRDFLKRIRDYREDWDLKVNQPVAGNYYPISLGLYIRDDSTELSVLVDRPVGGSSIIDGQLELMLHRRLLRDDDKGIAEALNETLCVIDDCRGLTIMGKHYLRIDPSGEGAKWRRTFGQEIYSPLLLAFTEQGGKEGANSYIPTFSALASSYTLPDNIALITLQELEDGNVLLRLAHLYEIGEDKDLSVMANVELKKLFPDKKIDRMVELNLSANQEKADMLKRRLVWKVEGSPEGANPVRGGPVDPIELVVELAPMEIRTFVLNFGS